MGVVNVTTGRVVAAQLESEIIPTDNANGEVVVFIFGVGRNANSLVDTKLAHQLADEGFASFSHAFGGDTCGNDTFLARMTDVMAYLDANYSQVHAVGVSMGACDLLNWMRRNPGRIKAASLIVPCCKLDAVYDRNGFVAAIINAAYGSAAAYEAALSSRDPWANVLTHTRDNLQFWYSTTDDTVIPTDVTDFAASQGRWPNTQGPVGHTMSGVDAARVAEFFRSV